MNISIITQPLLNNYGCLLQNFALQKVLQRMGCKPCTIDRKPMKIPLHRYLLSWLKTIWLCLNGKKKSFVKIQKPIVRKQIFDDFVQKFIATFRCDQNSKICLPTNTDAIIVGSDQVWRCGYNFLCLPNMFLNFCKKQGNLKRIAYAASFGVDYWEYSPKQTRVCSALAKKFDAISVREESGVKLCKEHLGVDAIWVLDPTLLLKKEDYLPICKNIPVSTEKYLAVYVLDESEQVTSLYEKEAVARKLVVKKFHADSKSTLTVPEWLAMFRDASYVVTDSFHGTVFSIIFEKNFKCVYNKSRGTARFESLLKIYNSGKLEEMRNFSINWLKNALEN